MYKISEKGDKQFNWIFDKRFWYKEQNIEVSFSGNTGFHIVVFDEEFLLLDSRC